ncbi:hypothetical protein ROZALSC1DRAFT_31220 [Rozella allomycis CSF55]|uniref:Cleavage and polyadenylation specificity factor subunit 5 n=1 Tax=Rozella allomycis (strain CSF55) TaxID=988480 RepID=A0A4P9YE50_ROZAC|nr:hypothetical protein ROZALSC1DRAFT_31220 [Rozella allomycis CSF55]
MSVIFPLSNYFIGVKDIVSDDYLSSRKKIEQLEKEYPTLGLHVSVEAVIVAHEHNHPLIFTPGGFLKIGEDEVEGLKRILNDLLAPVNETIEWEIGEVISHWWRPHFTMDMYPYPLPHIKQQKELKKVFLVGLPEKCTFSVPKAFKVAAVPMIDVYENRANFGAIISSIPHVLSRFQFVFA